MSPATKEIEVERVERGSGQSRARVHLAVAVFFTAAALLNGPALEREARLMKFGRARDWAIRLAAPLARLSQALYLDRPRQGIETWADRHLHTPVNAEKDTE